MDREEKPNDHLNRVRKTWDKLNIHFMIKAQQTRKGNFSVQLKALQKPTSSIVLKGDKAGTSPTLEEKARMFALPLLFNSAIPWPSNVANK